MCFYALLSHKQSFVHEQEKNMLHLWGILDREESFSELSLVLWYQGGLVLKERKGSGREGPLFFSFTVCLGLWGSAESAAWGGG